MLMELACIICQTTILKQRQFLLSNKDPCGWRMRRFLFLLSSFYIGNPKNCKHKKIQKIYKKWPMLTQNMAKNKKIKNKKYKNKNKICRG